MTVSGNGDLRGRSVLVTGATGFIGSRLVERLTEYGAEVHGVSRVPQVTPETPSVRWWHVDLEESEPVSMLLESVKPDVVFHLAGHVAGATSPELVIPTLRANLLSTLHVLEAVRQTGGRVLVACSVVEPELGPDELPASSPYAASKWASWGYARMYHALWDVDAVVLRVTMVYGPGKTSSRKLIPYVVETLLEGETPQVTSGRARYDWIFVDDVVEACIAASFASDIEGDTLEIGSGSLVSVREVVRRLANLVDPEAEVAYGELPDRPMEPPARTADTRRTAQLIGWKPATTLADGLERTVAWFKARAVVAVVPLAESGQFGHLGGWG